MTTTENGTPETTTPAMTLREALRIVDRALHTTVPAAPVSLDLQNAHNMVDDVLSCLQTIDTVQIPPALRASYEAAELIMAEHPESNADNHRLHLGWALMLDVLAASPEAVSDALRLLRGLLIDADPQLLMLRPRV